MHQNALPQVYRDSGSPCIAFIQQSELNWYCDDGFMLVAEVDAILLLINNKRTLLASGLQFNGELLYRNYPPEKLLPPSENIRNMTYDCALEQEAKSLYVKICSDNGMESEGPDRGYLFDGNLLTKHAAVWNKLSAIDKLDFSSFATKQAAVIYTDNDRNLTAYANLMRADASKIGCYYESKRCDVTKTIGDIYPDSYRNALLCVTDQKNIQDGDEIYKIGTPKAECNPLIPDVSPSVASEAEFPGSESEQSTICEWGEIDDTLRMQMLDTHNSRRETLALGQITDNTGAALPAATDMNTLEWNCTLEREAHDSIKSCPTEGYQRPDGESPAQNFYRGTITANEPTYRDMHKKTVTEWWKPVRKVAGPGQSVYFRTEHNSTAIKSFTLMGWGSTTQIGCSIAKCDGDWVEACRYYPPGNQPDERMYTPGRACSQCNRLGKSCNTQTGLCK